MKKVVALVAAGLLIAGCSSKDKASQNSAASHGPRDIQITTAFTPDPPRKGADVLVVMLKDGTGVPVKGATVKVETSMPSMSMGGPTVVGKDNGDGTYTARLMLQYATSWQFAVSARAPGKSGISQLTADVK